MLLHQLRRRTAWWPRSWTTRSSHVDRPAQVCQEVEAITAPFSPLIGELLALYCHGRLLSVLAGNDNSPQEFRLLARQIIQQLLDAWLLQKPGGTVEDLVLGLRPRDPDGGGAEAYGARGR
ncbi:MAG TPA: hypothetical protein DD420_34965 [Streptomyces sp.]|mgnify:CR=1 FL=1|nr:hypothetical protein [Streptomyces sp.]